MINFLPPARPSTPVAVYLNVLPGEARQSIQAFSWLGIPKLYIGAPSTTMSSARNSSSTPLISAGGRATSVRAAYGINGRNILFVALRCIPAKTAQGGTILSDTHIDVCEGGLSPEERRAFADILARIGDKWTVLVVGVLAHGPMRYSQIFKLVEGVSQRMLTLTLKSLERDGLVTRTVCPTNPPRVDYELTERGKTLIR